MRYNNRYRRIKSVKFKTFTCVMWYYRELEILVIGNVFYTFLCLISKFGAIF